MEARLCSCWGSGVKKVKSAWDIKQELREPRSSAESERGSLGVRRRSPCAGQLGVEVGQACGEGDFDEFFLRGDAAAKFLGKGDEQFAPGRVAQGEHVGAAGRDEFAHGAEFSAAGEVHDAAAHEVADKVSVGRQRGRVADLHLAADERARGGNRIHTGKLEDYNVFVEPSFLDLNQFGRARAIPEPSAAKFSQAVGKVGEDLGGDFAAAAL